MKCTYLLVQLFGVFHVISEAADWSYTGTHGPGHWDDTYPICGQSSQSPIDLPSTVYYNPDLKPFSFNNYNDLSDFTLRLHNNGHGAQVDITSGNIEDVTITEGGLPGTFKAAQLHFHWGSVDTKGSEHTMNGIAYPMEVHIVHYNTKYADIGTAIDKPDGLAVLGAFFTISTNDNPSYAPIVDSLSDITYYKDDKALSSFNLMTLLPSNNLDKFYRYQGSLTTPGCFQSVTWTVFEEAIPISSFQMSKFRTIMDNANQSTVDNFRPVQPLNGRNVYISYQATPSSWTYHGAKGPDNWSNSYSLCSGTSQSPIDLPEKSLMTYRTSLGMFEMTNYDNSTIHGPLLYNNGHGVQVNLEGNVAVTARNGGLPGTFKLAQFHFHWGSNNAMGSEHTYRGRSYPMEVHFVHYNTKYGDIGTAADKSDGLAVFGFFFEVGNTNNCNYNPVIDHLDKIKYPKTTATIPSFNIRHLMNEDMSRYYRYKGSLTTPACYESVTWTVFEQTIKLSSEQLAKFREVLDTSGHRTVDNFRPTLSLGTRVVYASFDTYVGAAPSVSAKHVLVTLLAVVAFLL
ncbi:carbonic anhydrase-like [Mizuhopecten yessoensis]|uniref:Carbonic anhydrase n=1 Tax=Mizuhopecten yessoensis TaxID=6573 RepID=A0A210PIM0_MIZYE|nr:carbonic anhydrase-like [Mizuhopecten yessoensis]OWF36341.1 Carbonic anhydrase [Mizuhopecten yessoensis]